MKRNNLMVDMCHKPCNRVWRVTRNAKLWCPHCKSSEGFVINEIIE